MGIGIFILESVTPLMESMAPHMPGETFPKFFTLEMFQRSLLAAVMVAIVGGFLGYGENDHETCTEFGLSLGKHF